MGAFVASLLIGLLIEPFRGTIGLENVVILYLLVVVVAAAIGGRTAGIVAAISAALAYGCWCGCASAPPAWTWLTRSPRRRS